jgi:hypothetical protein
MATLARGLLIAQLSILVALVFLSDGDDQRFWLLFALGPVLATLAARAPVRRRSPIGDDVHAQRSLAGAQAP